MSTVDDLLRAQERTKSIYQQDLDLKAENDTESQSVSDKNLENEATNQNSISRQFSRVSESRMPSILSRSIGSAPNRSSIKKTDRVVDFSSLGTLPSLVNALSAMSIKQPTEVQAACIPPLLAGRDCIGNAKTGSGKTIAFALPILQALSRDPYGIFAIVLTPTRELAFQISDQFSVLGMPFNIRTAIAVGGMDMISQAIELKERPHVVVATPGRLVDHLKSSSSEIDLSRVKFLVLDEADRLLTPSFAPELAHLLSVIPKDRQTALFTATLTPAVEQLGDAVPRPGKEKPFIHRMTERVETVSTLKQFYILAPSHMREIYLYWLLRNPPESVVHLRRSPPEAPKKTKSKAKATKPKPESEWPDDPSKITQPPPTIIFTPTAKLASYVTILLQHLHIRATALHSRLSQRQRLQSLSLFRSSTIPVLVTTDVGSRGLDIEDVAMVVSWNIPQEPETYTHRVGRTARAGRGGLAVSFVGGEEDGERICQIESRISTSLEEMTLPQDKLLEHLNLVSTAKRTANMELHDSDFGKREEIHQIKKRKREDDVQSKPAQNGEAVF